jgi:hypothetical protein
MFTVIRGRRREVIAELQTAIQKLAWTRGLVDQNEASQITAHENLSDGGIDWDVSELPAEKREPVLQMIKLESLVHPGPELMYCVMVPTHANPDPKQGLFCKTRRRKFSRHDDDVIMNYVAARHGGWTLLPPSTGCWQTGIDERQIEGMRPFLFTAKTKIESDIIADLICNHYGQETVMKFVLGYDVELRKRWEMIPFFTNVLVPKKRRWLTRLLT